MPIPTASVRAADGLQHSPKTMPTARAASAPGGISQTSESVAVSSAKSGDADKPGASQLQQSLEDINKVLAGFSISVQFQIDPDYKDLIVKVVDQDTGKLIRQIPTEDVVKMSKAMDSLKGLLFAQSV